MVGVSERCKVLLVLSGKGGVGKSTVASQLALSLSSSPVSLRVGLLDIDLCGPSLPHMLSLSSQPVLQSSSGHWLPVFYKHPHRQGEPTNTNSHGHLEVMSIGFLLGREDEAVIWRGPKKNAMIRQFLQDVQWSEDLDVLVVDTPPGTSDEHMSIVEHLKASMCGEGQSRGVSFGECVGAVLVTTPQAVSVHDVQRQLGFCLKCGLRVVGLVENMSGLVCSHCSHCTPLFSQGGGASLAREKDLPFLGTIPVDPSLAAALDRGDHLNPSSPALSAIQHIVNKLTNSFLNPLNHSPKQT